MRHQRALHLERPDAIARALDHVVRPAYEPEIAVLVAPCHVARVIQAIVPHLAGALRVAVVLLEKTEGFPVRRVDHDLPLLAILRERPVRADQVHLVLRVGHTHRAGFRLHPGECRHAQRRLGLSEALHELDAGEFIECLVNGRVQRLARDGAILERGEVVLGQILANQETENGRRCAKRGDTVILYHLQHVGGRELLVVVHEYGRSRDPLPV